ncbi:hypothetical protein J8M21_18040 [Pseudoalteromonas luteoviolacea]|uniref:hypothetical protein n=1 Tax=Pseudoalteromonas luteoviolacea TaxID=43657 RepID=UPI001B3A0A44|nr:hypothetical protein [Pseudoalteromonas luteoviolacea]MBQ4879121.1 hypothetical protein [Pseudoalteromonas luteoviolacea]MBQ4908124.1 hypothetical protein [Pseudoalteromonas luteoviolacea]
MKVVVVEAHVSEFPEPFFLNQGEQITLGNMDDEFPNWAFIKTQSGQQGWAPTQYIRKSSVASEGVLTQDYDNNELNTSVGENLTVLFVLNAWYRVKRGLEEIGWVPVSTVKTAK